MKYINKTSLTLLFLATTSVNADYYMNVDIAKKNGQSPFVIESPYDIFGFDENGIHRSGDVVDPEGFNADGLRPDSNSVVNSTLSQTLDNAYSVTLTQDVVEGNFGYVTGTLSFNTTPVTVSNVEGNSVILDNGLTSNPFPSGIEIIKNGVVETNSSSANAWQNTVNVYEEVRIKYISEWVLVNSGSYGYWRTNPNLSNGYVLQYAQYDSEVGYKQRDVVNGGWDREDGGRYLYWADRYIASTRYRNETRLVSSTTTDYFILNANSGDTVDVYMPIRLQVSIDGGLFEDVTLNRADANTNQLTFELPNLNARNLDFRITDLQHSTNLTDLTGIVIQPQMLRTE